MIRRSMSKDARIIMFVSAALFGLYVLTRPKSVPASNAELVAAEYRGAAVVDLGQEAGHGGSVAENMTVGFRPVSNYVMGLPSSSVQKVNP